MTERSNSEVKEWRKLKKISVFGDAPRPAQDWVEAQLPSFVLEYIKKRCFVGPTPIQSQGFPMAMSGNDLVCVLLTSKRLGAGREADLRPSATAGSAISETGSGKTLAYAAPAILHVMAQPPTDAASGPSA